MSEEAEITKAFTPSKAQKRKLDATSFGANNVARVSEEEFTSEECAVLQAKIEKVKAMIELRKGEIAELKRGNLELKAELESSKERLDAE